MDDEEVSKTLQRARERFGRRKSSEQRRSREQDATTAAKDDDKDEPLQKRQNLADDDDGLELGLEPAQKVATELGVKVIIGTKFVVDGFNLKDWEIPEGAVFFLTHAHSDHYGGITQKWNRPIWCTAITGALLVEILRIDRGLIRILNLNETVEIEGVQVTATDANHCPGACLLLFETAKTKVLHVGDFRWNRQAILGCAPRLAALKPRDIDHLYLDTTFNDPKFDFPLQEQVIAEGIRLASEMLSVSETALLFFGSYSIGKEKLFLAVADALNEKIYASSKKQALLRAAGCDMRRFVQRKEDARLRVVSLSKCSFDALCHFSLEQPQHDLVAGFSPSGWNWAKVSKRKYREQGILHTTRAYDRVVCIGLPYSEHSSYAELIECVAHFRPRVVIPTVLNTGKSKEAIAQQLIPFHPFIDLTNDKSTIIGLFSNASRTKSAPSQQPSVSTIPARSASAPSWTQRTLNFFFGK